MTTIVERERSDCFWGDTHVDPKNSKWLQDNLEEVNKRVKRMLELIEDNKDSCGESDERQTELIFHVEDLHHMYRSLAENYNYVTGEFKKHVPLDLRSPYSIGFGIGSEHLSQSEKTPPNQKDESFDSFLESSDSSHLSSKLSDESSSSVDSDSKYDNGLSKNLLSSFQENEYNRDFQRKIMELGKDIQQVKQKFQSAEKENGREVEVDAEAGELRTKVSNLEENLIHTSHKILDLEEDIKRLRKDAAKNQAMIDDLLMELESALEVIKSQEIQIKSLYDEKELHESEIVTYERKIISLETSLKLEKNGTSKLEELAQQLNAKLYDSSQKIAELEEANTRESECFKQENAIVEAELSYLYGKYKILESSHTELEEKVQSMEQEVSRLESEKIEVQELFERDWGTMKAELENVKAETKERLDLVDELNKNLNELKLERDNLIVERNQLNSDINTHNDHIRCVEERFHQLQLEQQELTERYNDDRKVEEELKRKVKMLEIELERSMVIILDREEEKREAIRQLCFSLDHFRDGYHQLRQTLRANHKRPVRML